MLAFGMPGVRLSFVVVALEGTVRRLKTRYTKDEGLVQEDAEEPAGFLVYFPKGHALRLKDEAALKKHGLDKAPLFINMQGLTDPNSPLGKIFAAQEEGARQGAYATIEEGVIRLATAMSGPVLLPEQLDGRNRVQAIPRSMDKPGPELNETFVPKKQRRENHAAT